MVLHWNVREWSVSLREWSLNCHPPHRAEWYMCTTPVDGSACKGRPVVCERRVAVHVCPTCYAVHFYHHTSHSGQVDLVRFAARTYALTVRAAAKLKPVGKRNQGNSDHPFP